MLKDKEVQEERQMRVQAENLTLEADLEYRKAADQVRLRKRID